MPSLRGEIWVTAKEFQDWLEQIKAAPKLGLRSDVEIAHALGVSTRHMLSFKANGVPLTASLAMCALEKGMLPSSRRGELEADVREHRLSSFGIADT